jgi:hypothetical protein
MKKKAEIDNLIRLILWIAIFALVSVGVVFVLRKLMAA